MIDSRYISTANGVRPSSTRHRKKWAAILCLSALLAPSAWTQAEQIDFVIDTGMVVPTEDFAVKVSVLGAAITSGGNAGRIAKVTHPETWDAETNMAWAVPMTGSGWSSPIVFEEHIFL